MRLARISRPTAFAALTLAAAICWILTPAHAQRRLVNLSLDAGEAVRNFAEWTDVLERVIRRPCRPQKTLANDEGFERFYTVPTAATARDRLLLALKRHHPERFAAVCALECSPREAAIRAGLIKVGPSPLRWSVQHRRGGGPEGTCAGQAALRPVQGHEPERTVHPNCACT